MTWQPRRSPSATSQWTLRTARSLQVLVPLIGRRQVADELRQQYRVDRDHLESGDWL